MAANTARPNVYKVCPIVTGRTDERCQTVQMRTKEVLNRGQLRTSLYVGTRPARGGHTLLILPIDLELAR